MVKARKEKLFIIKVGGAILEDEISLKSFLDHFVALPGIKILVHGGGREATKISSKLGIVSQMVDGRRITDTQTLEVVTMVYGGLINKKTVAELQARECNASGFTGADMNLILADKRPVKGVDFGFVGDISRVNIETFNNLLTNGITPVIAPLTHNGKGQLLNTNADSIASSIAVALSELYEVSLIFCFEKPGVLVDPMDASSLISVLNEQFYKNYIAEGIIHSGMIPKIDNGFTALKKGVQKVIITNASAFDINSGTTLSL